MEKLIGIVLVSLLISLPIVRVEGKEHGQKSESLKYLNQNIKEKEREIRSLRGRILDLEKNLGAKNQDLLALIEKKRKIQATVLETKASLEVMKSNLKRERSRLFSLIRKKALSDLNGNSELNELVARRVSRSVALNRAVVYEAKIKEVEKVKKQLDEIQKTFDDYEKTEADMVRLLGSLEDEKKGAVEKYLAEDEKRKKMQNKLLDIEKKIAEAKQKVSGISKTFKIPVETFRKYKQKDKGILFLDNSTMAVVAPGEGKIVYVGKLSTYGDVIMIDHGADTRSILLGKLKTKVKKGDEVTTGQVLGYTRQTGNKGTDLYYEVRKRNQVQNTLALVELPGEKKDSLAMKKKN